MNRLFDFQREEAGEVISRIAVAVHKAVDDHFPQISNHSKKFTKTTFSAEDTELNTPLRHEPAPASSVVTPSPRSTPSRPA